MTAVSCNLGQASISNAVVSLSSTEVQNTVVPLSVPGTDLPHHHYLFGMMPTRGKDSFGDLHEGGAAYADPAISSRKDYGVAGPASGGQAASTGAATSVRALQQT